MLNQPSNRKMRISRPPTVLRFLFPGLIWAIPNDENKVFLTFDDGPDPEVTPWVLDVLGKHQAKATFFCLGRKVERYPELFERIKNEGHTVGNHSYSHPDGWKTRNSKYFADVERADQFIQSKLFRPPFGRIKPSQIHYLRLHYRIIIWSILSFDFLGKMAETEWLKNLLIKSRPGSIIVFHDLVKAETKLKYGLPRLLSYFQEKNWSLEKIPENI